MILTRTKLFSNWMALQIKLFHRDFRVTRVVLGSLDFLTLSPNLHQRMELPQNKCYKLHVFLSLFLAITRQINNAFRAFHGTFCACFFPPKIEWIKRKGHHFFGVSWLDFFRYSPQKGQWPNSRCPFDLKKLDSIHACSWIQIVSIIKG